MRRRQPTIQHVTRPLASASRATTFPRGTRCCRHGPRRKSASLVTFLRGWQHRAAFASDKRALDAASPALLLSLAGPHAARAFAVLPTSAELMVPSPLLRVLLLRRLRLPLPVAPRTCACRGRLDPLLGDHRAACATSGVLASRALPLERAVARVSQEAGARVARNVRLADMSIDVPVSDDRRIEVVANWLSLWHGAQQAVDATIVSPVTRAGSRRTPRSSCRWRRRTQMPPDLPRARACSPLPLGGRRCRGWGPVWRGGCHLAPDARRAACLGRTGGHASGSACGVGSPLVGVGSPLVGAACSPSPHSLPSQRLCLSSCSLASATSPEKRRICTKSLLTCAGSFRRWAAARGLAIVLWQERFRRTDQAPTTGILGCRQRSGEKKFDSHTITRRVSHGFKSRGCIPFGP